MFRIDDGTITMSRGDTASFTVTADGHEFETGDRALLTVKDGAGKVVLERVYELDTELGNGVFMVRLSNSDTDQLAPGTYRWDVRYVLQPCYDETGRIIGGEQVITPKAAQTLRLIASVGEV